MENNIHNQIVVENQVVSKPNSLATAAMVCGIIGLVVGFIPFIGWIVSPLWILSIVFGALSLKKIIGRGAAITGIVTGSVAILYKIMFWIIIIIAASASNVNSSNIDNTTNKIFDSTVNTPSSSVEKWNK